MKYTEEQYAVASNRSSRLLVKALAGTGKTETVALRIQSLIDGGTDPLRIQALCFTRSAKKQLRKRLDSKGLHAVNVSTVHGMAYRIVKDWCAANGEVRRIVDGDRIAAKALQELGITPSKTNIGVVKACSTGSWNGFMNGAAIGNLSSDEIKAAILLYNELKLRYAVLDFDDLAAIAGHLAEKLFDEVIVDEAQDLSQLQVRLVENLTADRLTYVGDTNQAIFAFAGTDGAMLNTLSDWSQCTLTKSFRSTEEIISIANQVSDERLYSQKYGGAVTVNHVNFEDVAKSVRDTVVPGSSIAVIGRSKSSLKRIADALVLAGLVVQTSWDEEEVSDPDVIISTVHKAKGGEWDRVIVVDLTVTGFNGCEVNDEEQRLFYVAVTRAKNRLELITLDGELPWKVQN